MRNLSFQKWVFVIVVGIMVLTVAAIQWSGALSAPAAAPKWKPLNPAHVEGYKKCVDCHQVEVAAWRKTRHANVTYDELRTSPNSRNYAKNMGIPIDRIARDSLCIKCHATPHQVEGNLQAFAGVSCESCHGASGGKDGWLNLHAVYGPTGTRRNDETREHHDARMAACTKAGQRNSVNLYQLVKNCYQCHLVPNEKLVNHSGGHRPGNPAFEFVEWSNGEVRHNFHLDRKKNAKTATLWTHPQFGKKRTAAEGRRLRYVLGQLADLEVSLRNRANATEAGTFATSAATRATAALTGKLPAINGVAPMPELKTAIDAGMKVLPKLFLPPAADQKKEFEAAADEVAAAANKIAATRDGSKMAGLDVFVPKTEKGPVYQPE